MMKIKTYALAVLTAGLTPFLLCPVGAASAGEAAFNAKPAATVEGQGARVAFAVNSPCDVEVTVLDSAGKEIRHLAAGMLGAKDAATPLKPASLSQTLVWDRTDDYGQPVKDARCRVRVRLGLGVSGGRVIMTCEPQGKKHWIIDRVETQPDPFDPGKIQRPAGTRWPIDADKQDDRLYASQNYGGHVHRYVGQTGKVDELSAKIGVGRVTVGRDGALCRGPYARWTRELESMPPAAGTIQHTGLRFGNAHDVRLMSDSPFADHWGPTLRFEGMDGRFYQCTTRLPPYFELHVWDTWDRKRALRGGYQPWVDSANYARMGWARVDAKGHMYVSKRYAEKGFKGSRKLPEGCGSMRSEYGSILKFAPAERWARELALPWGAAPDDPEKLKTGVFFGRYGWFVPAVEKVYNGVALVGGGCSCDAQRFDLDEHGRLYLPNHDHLLVLDNAGNEIARIEKEIRADAENADKKLNLAGLHDAAVSRKAVYLYDNVNLRILRIGLTWAATEECALP